VLDEEEVGRPRARGARASTVALALLVHCAPAASERVEPIEISIGSPSPSGETAASSSAPRRAAIASPPPASAGRIRWGDDLDAAFEQARQSRRPLLVFVRAGWSSASIAMERTELAAEIVERASRPYVRVIVDLVDDDVLARTEARLGVSLDKLPAIELVDLGAGRHASLRGEVTAEQLAEALGTFVSRDGRSP